MKILKINRQWLEDLCGYFLPFMTQMLDSKVQTFRGSDTEAFYRVCSSVMNDLEKLLIKKYLAESNKFKIKLTEAQAILLLKLMLQFPIPADHFWRINLRNNIVDQLDRQLA